MLRSTTNAANHAQASVEPAAIGHRIEVTAEHERLLRSSRKRRPAISGSVQMMLDGETRGVSPETSHAP